jgi:hypothetical protein
MPAGGTIIGTARGAAASWSAEGVPELGRGGELERGRCAGTGARWLCFLKDDLQRGNQQDQPPRDLQRRNGDAVLAEERCPGQRHKHAEHGRDHRAPDRHASLESDVSPLRQAGEGRDELNRPKKHEECRKDKGELLH